MSVKRYYWDRKSDCDCEIVEQPDGAMVDYDEHASVVAALEARCAALAAENAGLKAEVPMGSIVNGRAFADRLEAYPFECQGGNLNMCSDWQELLRCFEHLSEWAMHGQPETPSTDAFLAEVRAQGVEAAIGTAKNVVAQEFQYKDFETAQRVCSKFPESDLVGKVEMVEWLEDFADQLRKGVQS